MNLDHEFQVASDLARKAGVIALDVRDRIMFSYKPDGQGPVTNVDYAVDQFLCEAIKKAFPSDMVISEESYVADGVPLGMGRVWFIDPIDGTSALVAGTEEFVIMIGLSINGVARLGVVYQPTTDFLWRGIFSDQCLSEKIEHGMAHPMAPPIPCPKPSKLTVIASMAHKSLRQRAMIQALSPAKVIFSSSIGLKAMLILDGEADFYVAWSKKIKLWDTCAPAAIIAAASGNISGINGQPLVFLGSIDHGFSIMIARFKPDKHLMAMLAAIAN